MLETSEDLEDDVFLGELCIHWSRLLAACSIGGAVKHITGCRAFLEMSPGTSGDRYKALGTLMERAVEKINTPK